MLYLLIFSEKKINRGFKNVYKTDADEEERTVIKIDRRAASVVDETRFLVFSNTIFVSSRMYPENPKGTQAIVGSMTLPGLKLQPVMSQLHADSTRSQ